MAEVRPVTLYLDTNVLLDHLIAREPFANAATTIWNLTERRVIVGCVSALSFTIVHYIIRRHNDQRTADAAVRMVRSVFQIVAVDDQIINQAIEAGDADFEDAVQLRCAVRIGAEIIVTRNARDFRNSEIPVLSPAAFLAQFNAR